MHIETLLTWVNGADQLVAWAGPNMHYPCSVTSLTRDLSLDKFRSFSLVSAQGELMAFGQYYSRLDRCHLCRLIVSPDHRGKGLVQRLIDLIVGIGVCELGVSSSSLFVHTHNLVAIRAYKKIGYKTIDYTGGDLMENCFYMIRSTPSGDID